MSDTLIRLSMSDKKYEEITNLVSESYPNSCICWIDQVNNTYLEYEFTKLFDSIVEKRKKIKPKIVQMFHGTKEENVSPIIYNGFDTSKNKVSAYGIGTYFAKKASYSYNYMHPGKEQISYMFLSDVIFGSLCTTTGKIDIDRFDNSVDNFRDPTICVTPYDFGAIPRYIIAFYKNTK